MKKLWQAQISASFWLPWSQAFILSFCLPCSSNALLLIFLHLAVTFPDLLHWGSGHKTLIAKKGSEASDLDTPVKHRAGCEEEGGAAWKPNSLHLCLFLVWLWAPDLLGTCWQPRAVNEPGSCSLHSHQLCTSKKLSFAALGWPKLCQWPLKWKVPFSFLF